MEQTDELHIDSQKFMREGARLQGSVAVASLHRLSDGLPDSGGMLAYRLESAHDRRDRPLLKLTVKGAVQLQCQRCLEAFTQVVVIDTALRLVAPEKLDQEYDESDGDPNEPDCIAHDKALDVAALIEDEVLLALPPYPRHADGRCAAQITAVTGAKVLAFDALKALKRN